MKKFDVVEILLIEDDTVDAEVVTRAFRQKFVLNVIHVFKECQTALDFLHTKKDHPNNAYIILLDLNLPGMSGIEFLQELRGYSELKNSFVFVLSTSSSSNDFNLASSYNIQGYLVKSKFESGIAQIIDFIQSINA